MCSTLILPCPVSYQVGHKSALENRTAYGERPGQGPFSLTDRRRQTARQTDRGVRKWELCWTQPILGIWGLGW
jgi:hypothetical protein